MEIKLLTVDELLQNGIAKLTRVDNKYCEITAEDKKTFLRTYYSNNKGTADFYYNNICYRIENFKRVVPLAKGKPVLEIEDDEFISVEEYVANPDRTITIDMDNKVVIKPHNPDEVVKHHQHETIKTCIAQDIPVYLVGEAGTGKNYTLQAIAEEIGLEFYFTNSVQQEYKITGFIDAGGVYHETEFYKAFLNGGLFFLDEIDASIPEVLVLLNAAIANRYFEFPTGRINAHPDFRVVAAGNTIGAGANELYTGRLVLDSATLDRFVVIEFDYDKNIELQIAGNNVELVNFIRCLREFAKKNGVRATFSYRCIMSVTKLETAGLPLTDIIKIAVLKGLDKDVIRTLKVEHSGKYYYALLKLQAA